MNEQMIEAILQLVREGGQAAIYIVVVYYIIGLSKFALGMGIIGYAISKLYDVIKYGPDWKSVKKLKP